MQNSAELLFNQDVLTQNGNNTVNIAPTHKPTIPMRHAHSMIDFMILEAEESDIDKVVVVANNITYEPYRVEGVEKIEYMVIIPTGVANPEIQLTTVGGIRYRKELDISSTAVNRCYCIQMEGLELLLSTITVSDWTYGTPVAGDYSTITSYPTLKGPANESCILHFDNGLEQEITFNDRGECTIKPRGRTIVAIEYKGVTTTLDTPLVLRNMSIDLTNYLVEPL